MSATTAKAIEYAIIGLCLAALAMIFQPFSLTLYSVGAGLVVLGALAFNLIPHCRPGVPVRWVIKVAVIILIILVIALALAITAAYLYAWYLAASR
jgi:hypothetical protein